LQTSSRSHYKAVHSKECEASYKICPTLIKPALSTGGCCKIKNHGITKKESRRNSNEDANPENVHKEPK